MKITINVSKTEISECLCKYNINNLTQHNLIPTTWDPYMIRVLHIIALKHFLQINHMLLDKLFRTWERGTSPTTTVVVANI